MSFQIVALTVSAQYWSPSKSDRKTRKKSFSCEHWAGSVLANFLSVTLIKTMTMKKLNPVKCFWFQMKLSWVIHFREQFDKKFVWNGCLWNSNEDTPTNYFSFLLVNGKNANVSAQRKSQNWNKSWYMQRHYFSFQIKSGTLKQLPFNLLPILWRDG